MQITLPSPVTVNAYKTPKLSDVQEPESFSATISTLTLRTAIDDPILKETSASFYELRFPVLVWGEENYDKQGDWTQSHFEQAVKDLVTADPVKVVTEGMTFPNQTSSESSLNERMQKIKTAFPNGMPIADWVKFLIELPSGQAPQSAKNTSQSPV